jgi:hypothetical protein
MHTTPQFVYSFINGYCVFPHLLSIENNAIMKLRVQISVEIAVSGSLGAYT